MSDLMDLAKRPRCMECWGFGRVPGLILCEKCVDRLPPGLLNLKSQQNPVFRLWWNLRKNRIKTEQPVKRSSRMFSESLLQTLLRILEGSDRPLSSRELWQRAEAEIPEGGWGGHRACVAALKAAFDEGLVSRFGGVSEAGSGRAYFYSLIRQEEERQSA